ncbi:MAG: glycine zipper 2TM domain-containing protein [Sphingomonas sp.]
MRNFIRLAAVGLSASVLVSGPALAQSAQDEARFQQAQQRLQSELQNFQREYDLYQQARARGNYQDQRYNQRNFDSRYPSTVYNDDRDENGYDPARYYRDGNQYQERPLAADDRVYRGSDGRYYCKRNDGTTGLIIGAVGGGVLGNVIDGGRSRAVGTILGGVLGAVAGKAIDQGSSNRDVRCR